MDRMFRREIAVAVACLASVVKRYVSVRWVGAVTMSLVAGCSTPYRSVVADVEARMWCDPVELILPNVDTLNEFDWQLFVRSDDRIAADTFTLRIAVETPDSLRFEEPFFVRLPARTVPAALLRENIVGYRCNVRLSRAGDYRLIIRPTRPLRGFEAVGIQTVKSN